MSKNRNVGDNQGPPTDRPAKLSLNDIARGLPPPTPLPPVGYRGNLRFPLLRSFAYGDPSGDNPQTSWGYVAALN